MKKYILILCHLLLISCESNKETKQNTITFLSSRNLNIFHFASFSPILLFRSPFYAMSPHVYQFKVCFRRGNFSYMLQHKPASRIAGFIIQQGVTYHVGFQKCWCFLAPDAPLDMQHPV